jgi:hypothetical protein
VLDGACASATAPVPLRVLPAQAVGMRIAADWPGSTLVVGVNGQELENVGPSDTQRQLTLRAAGTPFWIPQAIDVTATPPVWSVYVDLPASMRTGPLSLVITSRKADGTAGSPLTVAVVQDLHAQAPEWNRVQLQWRDRTGETGYVLERRLGGGSFAQIAQLAADTTTYTDQQTDGRTTYDYRVMALGCAGSGPVQVTTPEATGVDTITLSRGPDDPFAYRNPVVVGTRADAVVQSVTNVATDANGNDGAPSGGVPLDDLRHTDGRGVQRSTGSQVGCPALLAPQAATQTFDGTTVAGDWSVRAACISNALLRDYVTLRVAWRQGP